MTDILPARHAWTADSLMARVDLGQTEANIKGRARVKAGVLKPSSQTKWLAPSDYAAQDFIIAERFLDDAQCDRLAETFKALQASTKDRKVGIAFWEGRIVYMNEVAAHAPEVAAVMADFQKRATAMLSDFYRLTQPLYADTVQLNVWGRGSDLPPHTDNSNPDGSRHTTPWRDFASIVYLNDDYQGGQLYFTRADKVLRPKKGMLVAFSAGYHHEHGVLQVKNGRRITMPAFYTFDARRADKHIHPPAAAPVLTSTPLSFL